MKHRATEDYNKMWKTLLDKAIELIYDIPDKPKILLDFEKASSKAFKNYFPEGEVLRCSFHLWQTILKNLKKKSVYLLYLNNREINVLVKK